jgi:hypothetical protein
MGFVFSYVPGTNGAPIVSTANLKNGASRATNWLTRHLIGQNYT